jgi:hypothetical protein
MVKNNKTYNMLKKENQDDLNKKLKPCADLITMRKQIVDMLEIMKPKFTEAELEADIKKLDKECEKVQDTLLSNIYYRISSAKTAIYNTLGYVKDGLVYVAVSTAKGIVYVSGATLSAA